MQQNRRKVFFEGLSSKTTTNSLKAYLSADYELKACLVPNEHGKNKVICSIGGRKLRCFIGINKGYGIVEFFDERSMDALMDERPHRIDGKEVEIYRSVLNQGSLKGVKKLIVSQIKDKLSTSDLKRYFRKYGSIVSIQMNDEDNFCRIQFEE